MKINEIYSRYPKQSYSDTYEVEEIYPNYDSLQDKPVKGWMPDMENDPAYTVKFHYSYDPPSRGSRERGSGMQLEPDYGMEISLDTAEIFDPKTNQWIKINPRDYFSDFALNKVEDQIAYSLEDSQPDPEPYYNDDF